jgi:ADP-dependent NAD(P)H-hydrate dehydratase / NAD(P)H-hydrate epimerase
MKLVTVDEMRAIEQEADADGLSYSQMMENAGHGLADEIQILVYSDDEDHEALGLVGPGNNGGDTLVALAHLAADGWRTRAYLVRRKVDNDPLIERLRKEGGEIIQAENDAKFDKLSAFVSTADVVVDGVLGTGFQLPLKADVAKVLAAVNKAVAELSWPPYVVAVDCPSGVDSDTGEAAEDAIPASVTVCMAAIKQGLLRFPAFELAGELRVADIGLTDEVKSWKKVKHFVADDDTVEDILPLRPADSHKGTFGTALIAAGSINYTGAPLLAGKAAYRVGAGLVQMAVPGPVHMALAGHFPEATWVMLPHEMGVIAGGAAVVLMKNFERATALLIGPGLGTEDSTKEFIENLLMGKSSPRKSAGRIGFVHSESEKKEETNTDFPSLVVDADGLRLLAKIDDWAKLLPADSILTPHPGEMAALTGLEKDVIQSDRLATALKYAREWGHVVVLKGAFSVIAAPDGRAALIPVATPALARAGTGDVLAGLIVGLRAQGVAAYEAAVAGAWIHAQSGLYAAEKVGAEASVLAGDVLDAVADVLSGF